MWERIKGYLKEIIFPINCIDCGVEGEWLCQQCRKKIKFDSRGACPVCGIRTDSGVPCNICKAVSSLDGATALFNYDEQSVIGKLIKVLKYSWASDSARVWKNVFSNFIIPKTMPVDATFIPVPLYSRRLRERGFNQASVLAREFLWAHPQLNWMLDDKSLKRIRHTAQQAKLSGAQRRTNLIDAFEWRGNAPAPEHVIIFDDVFTTGTTVQECAKVLKQAGAQTVWALAVARG